MREKPSRTDEQLQRAYEQMAQDEKRETEALKWAEATVGDVSDARA
jgi:hypothetical protein